MPTVDPKEFCKNCIAELVETEKAFLLAHPGIPKQQAIFKHHILRPWLKRVEMDVRDQWDQPDIYLKRFMTYRIVEKFVNSFSLTTQEFFPQAPSDSTLDHYTKALYQDFSETADRFGGVGTMPLMDYLSEQMAAATTQAPVRAPEKVLPGETAIILVFRPRRQEPSPEAGTPPSGAQ